MPNPTIKHAFAVIGSGLSKIAQNYPWLRDRNGKKRENQTSEDESSIDPIENSLESRVHAKSGRNEVRRFHKKCVMYGGRKISAEMLIRGMSSLESA